MADNTKQCLLTKRPLHKCLGCVLINCHSGYPHDYTIVNYSVKECKNITRSGVCKKCRRITMNLCGETYPTANYDSLINRINELRYSMVEEVRFVDCSEKVFEIFNAIDWLIIKMPHQYRIKYYEQNKFMFLNTEYDFCKRNSPWW